VDFRLLGPFDVVENGRSMAVGGAKQRALLAILVIHANEVVPADRLIEQLWPGDTPDSAVNTLQAYVSRPAEGARPEWLERCAADDPLSSAGIRADDAVGADRCPAV
jgi:hypothetical protein